MCKKSKQRTATILFLYSFEVYSHNLILNVIGWSLQNPEIFRCSRFFEFDSKVKDAKLYTYIS